MKAIKLYKIQWDLKNIPNEEREKVLETLPKAKGFTTQDDKFNVAERVPQLLKKKYGYNIIDFAFAELRVVDTVEDLLLLCARTAGTIEIHMLPPTLEESLRELQANTVAYFPPRLEKRVQALRKGMLHYCGTFHKCPLCSRRATFCYNLHRRKLFVSLLDSVYAFQLTAYD